MEKAIETQGLTKTYRGNIQALKSLDLSVATGQAFGLLGPNGAGKSTLVKTLLSIVHPSAGSATLLGKDFRRPGARKGIGYLPEGHRFPRYLTGRQVCHYFGRLAGLSGIQLKEETEEKLDIVGMAQWGDTKVSKYSKGMAQRVGLAQALLGDPKLIFLDEPTDGVDPVGRKEIRDVIASACSDGTTVFLNSHLLSEVEQICDHVAIMNKGEIIQQGTVSQITSAVTGTGKLKVKFLTSEMSSDAWANFRNLGATQTEDKGFLMPLEGEEDITRVVDALRREGLSIYAVEPQRANLEDAFINLISGDGNTDV